MLGKAVVVVLLGLLCYHFLQVCERFGYFNQQKIYDHLPGPCRLVPRVENGSEDAQVTPDGKLFVTSGLAIFNLEDPVFEQMTGQIFLLDTNEEQPEAVSLPIKGDFDHDNFRPHGISLWNDPKTGELIVYVVNHFGPYDRVEKFLYDSRNIALRHLQSISDPNMILVNDLHVLGADRFYYTNCNGYRSLGMMMAQFLSPVGFGSVGLYDGSRSSSGASRALLVDTGLMLPNGINGSPDGKYLYVAIALTGSMNVYRINKDGSITLHDVIALHSGLDNIDVVPETGEVFIGSHPSMARAMKMSQDPMNSMAPSQVLRLKMKDGHATAVEETLSLNGTLLYGSSVAVYVNKRLYIGTVSHRLMICDVLYMS